MASVFCSMASFSRFSFNSSHLVRRDDNCFSTSLLRCFLSFLMVFFRVLYLRYVTASICALLSLLSFMPNSCSVDLYLGTTQSCAHARHPILPAATCQMRHGFS